MVGPTQFNYLKFNTNATVSCTKYSVIITKPGFSMLLAEFFEVNHVFINQNQTNYNNKIILEKNKTKKMELDALVWTFSTYYLILTSRVCIIPSHLRRCVIIAIPNDSHVILKNS